MQDVSESWPGGTQAAKHHLSGPWGKWKLRVGRELNPHCQKKAGPSLRGAVSGGGKGLGCWTEKTQTKTRMGGIPVRGKNPDWKSNNVGNTAPKARIHHGKNNLSPLQEGGKNRQRRDPPP